MRQFNNLNEVKKALKVGVTFYRLYGFSQDLNPRTVIEVHSRGVTCNTVFISDSANRVYEDEDYFADMQNREDKAVFTDKHMAQSFMDNKGTQK